MDSIVIKTEPIEPGLSESAGSLFVLLVVAASVLFYIFRKHQQAKFGKLGLPIVENCNFLLGNLADYARMPLHNLLQQWTKKYGKSYVYFEGPTPILITSDLNLLQEVFIKQFQNFCYRKEMPLVPDAELHPYVHSFIANGPRWKRLRQCSSAFFTTGRLRNMHGLINSHANELAEQISTESGAVNIHSLVIREVYDLQQQVTLGKNEGTLRNRDKEPQCMKLMNQCLDPSKVPAIAVLAIIFPEARAFWNGIFDVFNKFKMQRLPGYELFYHVKAEVPRRLGSVEPEASRAVDGDAASRCPSMLEFLSNLVTDCREVPLQQPTSRPELTYSEMVAELFVSFFTQQTFNLTFSMCLHLLAKHPIVQTRLFEEISSTFPSTDDNNNNEIPIASASASAGRTLDYDKVSSMQYLDMVVNEVFRMYPVFQIVHRRCVKSTRIGNLDIPAGVTVQPDVWSIHYDPEIWGDDVEVFNPERFSAEKVAKRNPLAMLTFGAGPRMCLGRRFVLLHMKTLLCVLLHRFTVLPHPTGDGLNCMPLEMETFDLDMIIPKEKIFVQFVPRNC